jgi:hypothetical protein
VLLVPLTTCRFTPLETHGAHAIDVLDAQGVPERDHVGKRVLQCRDLPAQLGVFTL